MIPPLCKRIAEVDFPIAVVSRHAAREKSIRHGHPSTLHLWWARRPLAACRAMLLGLLLPDPADAHCPERFKTQARDLLRRVPGRVGKSDKDLRRALLKFMGDFANWDLASNQTYLEVGRGLVKAAHGAEAPLVVDPFAGGGSIPLEALRLGCEAFASDLNPVACLILKVMLEDIPRHANAEFRVKNLEGEEVVLHGLAGALRHVGRQVKEAAEKALAKFYPPDPGGAQPIAYLWARTVRCESPLCGAEIPLVRSFWLCAKEHRRRALKILTTDGADDTDGTARNRSVKSAVPRVRFEVFEPRSEGEVPKGTVRRANATCPCCGAVLPAPRVRAQLAAQRGGADVVFDGKGRRSGGARLLAVVTLRDDAAGRQYRIATDRDYAAVWAAQKAAAKLPKGAVPDEPSPAGGGSGAGRAFSVQKYGMMTFGDLFTARQKLGLCHLADRIAALGNSRTLNELLALALGRCCEQMSSLVRWRTTVEAVAGTFGRQALPIMWDFAEILPVGDEGSNFTAAFEWVSEVAEKEGRALCRTGQTQQADSCESPLPDLGVATWFTDPPYYDAVPYADLSDFFLVWLKRALPGHPLLRDSFDPQNPLTPKLREAVQDEVKQVDGRPKDRTFFEETMARAFAEGRRVLKDEGVGCVVFAHKTTEGWEALLSGMIRGGWVITGSWPIATERPGRLRSQESAALATSIHLVCRPRTGNAVGDWSDVLGELPERVRSWMERLEKEGIRGADLVFACIGPALEIYSRYAKVVDANDREILLGGDPGATEPYRRGYLAYVWEVVGRVALEQILGTAEAKAQNGGSGALEEDARLTALFLWTLQSTSGQAVEKAPEDEDEDGGDGEEEGTAKGAKRKGLRLVFDVARRFAQPLGIHLEAWERRIIETDKGVVRLLPVQERAAQLFGEDGARGMAARLDSEKESDRQLSLFPQAEEELVSGLHARKPTRGLQAQTASAQPHHGVTTLDRVHAAMLLQASGQANALRSLLQAEQDRGPDFLRLANALSALYPKDSEEKRLLDAMLLAVPK